MSGFMEEIAFGGEAILFPLLFKVNQSPLPLTEHKVLEPGERQELILSKHGYT